MTDINFSDWTEATANLPWGAQRVFMSTLEAVRDEQATLVYGADYHDGKPCLVNAAATMLSGVNGVGGTGKPTSAFPDLVIAFDNINWALYRHGVNPSGNIVSPMAAEVLIRHFGPMKDQPVADAVKEATANETYANAVYVEPSDEDMMRDLVNAMSQEPVVEHNLDLKPEFLDPSVFPVDANTVEYKHYGHD